MFRRFLNFFKKPQKSEQDTEKLVESVLLKLTNTTEEEFSCDEVHELIDYFTELRMAGEDVPHLMPLMQKHLDLCPDCREEHEALMSALAYEKSLGDEY